MAFKKYVNEKGSMAQARKLQNIQVQHLTMTPEMKLSLEILQYDYFELGQFLVREIEANPLLELADDSLVEGPAVATAKEATDENDSDLSTSVFTNDDITDNKASQADSNTSFHTIGSQTRPASERDFIQDLREEKSFHDHLYDQLHLLALDPHERLIAHNLADNLDESGYLAVTLAECARQLGCTAKEVEKVLKRLQGLEPAGLFARDLKECLALQMKDRGLYDTACARLLDHLDLVAKGDLKNLKAHCRLSEPVIKKLIEDIRHLDPKPGLQFASASPTETLIPDAFVKRTKKGNWEVELNTEVLPRLLVNEEYCSALAAKQLKGKEGQFLKNCSTRASWLKRALDQRARTILKVIEALVAMQSDFFSNGVRSLKPLTLSDIAQKTKLHESTISRVVQNKFLSSPRGNFRLKYFFSSTLGAVNKEDTGTSAKAVKARIQDLIANEDTQKPLSDQKIAKVLKSEGVVISRRTVMKYREFLKIPTSFKRRKTLH